MFFAAAPPSPPVREDGARVARDGEARTSPAGGHDARTRDRVLSHVLELGPVTAAALADRLDLTPTAVRRHLEALTEAGDIAPSEAVAPQRGRGRPARAYVVTPNGHRRLDSDYAGVACAALDYVAAELGADAIADLARRRFDELAARYEARVDAAGTDLHERASALARALAADGFAASARPVGMDTPLEGVQLCQGHCPMQRVAARYPQFCEAETEAFARLLGVHVQRLATLANGEHVCTTYVPRTPGTSPPPEASDTPATLDGTPPPPRAATTNAGPTDEPQHRHERTPR